MRSVPLTREFFPSSVFRTIQNWTLLKNSSPNGREVKYCCRVSRQQNGVELVNGATKRSPHRR
uniref:Uncharacterized protein n=1 Tax=Siphoviridae sp. ct5kv15 TaxID=2825338 RepID=A0A8S5PML5_9CAUD|nr:MAG TPA: hypothetical protein [Siphoviridae sp. ct5kv15]